MNDNKNMVTIKSVSFFPKSPDRCESMTLVKKTVVLRLKISAKS